MQTQTIPLTQQQVKNIIIRRVKRILSGYRRVGIINLNHYARILRDIIPILTDQQIMDFDHIKSKIKNGIISALVRDNEDLQRNLDNLRAAFET